MVNGIQWVVLLSASVPVVAFGARAHLESVGRHRRAIELALEYDERDDVP